MEKPKGARRGYTILEVLIAMVILGIVLPGLSYMVITSRKTQVSSQRHETAAAIAQQLMDELSLLPPARLASLVSKDGLAYKTYTVDKQDYSITWKLINEAAGGRKIEITMLWNVGGKPHSSILMGAVR